MTTLSPRSVRPTMVDVAREAEVSLKTVSRVVNAEPGVRADTARRVREVIDRLGFQRNDGASQLRRGRTASIGLIVEDLANPFYSQLAASVEREARREECLLFSASAEDSPQREAGLLAALLARRVDGLIVVPAVEDEPVERPPRTWGTPLVYVDRLPSRPRADAVVSDNVGGIRSAVEHLVAHGHRRIGFLGDDPRIWTARQRQKAFRATSTELRLPGEPLTAMGPHTPESIAPVLKRWCSGRSPVTAVVTGNNRITVSLLHAERRLGTHLSLVGYDDFELASLLEPAVTVVHQDPAALGRHAAQQLFRRLRGDDSPPQTETVPTRLIVRQSGAAS